MEETIEKIKKEEDIFSKAKLIKYLLEEKSIKVIDLAKRLSITSSYLCHLNRLNKLPDIVVDGYYSKLISVSYLFLISRVKDEKKLIEIYEKVLSDNLTIRKTEDLIREVVYEVKNKGNYIKPKEKNELLNRIKEKVPNAEVRVHQTRTKGTIFLEIKGNLEKTSGLIKEIFRKLTN